jgi:hypothetical protein
MLKHLLVGSLALSSLALARPETRRPDDRVEARVELRDERFGRGDRRDERREDRLEVRARQLLRAFDEAVARRDVRALRSIDAQFERLIERSGRRDLERQLARLQGRMGYRALSARRGLYTELL